MKQAIQSIRAFNRFYTNVLGLHQKHLLQSQFTLPEVRIMFEIFHAKNITASDIIQTLDIDKGYLSRLIQKFEKRGLIHRVTAPHDKRSSHILMTSTGRAEFEQLNQASSQQIAQLTQHLGKKRINELVSHMQAIKNMLSENHEH